MKLRTKLLLILISVFLVLFTTIEILSYISIRNSVLNDMRREARDIRSVLMATRRVYHRQFLDSGISLTDKTLGFLPAHSLSRISSDFRNWTTSELYFNNVSDRPRNPKNAADSVEMEAINYFRTNPDEKERFVPFESEEGKSFYHFSAPIWIEEYCLKCHGKREDAPAAIRTRYASSFNYEMGDLRGVMSIKLPSAHLNSLVWTHFKIDLWINLAGLFGMFFLISWLLNRYVNKPLNKLVVGLESVASGDFDHPIDGLSGEMAIVSNTFNDMSIQLSQRENELNKFNESLEQRVSERTAELTKANELLQKEVTERKKMEEALLQSEKLKSIGTITAGISHEYNNILAIISGNIQLLEGSRKDDEELTNALRTIKRATNDGAEISRRMLKFTKTAEDTTGFVPFNINELINQAIDFTKPRWKNMAQAKGINYHMDTEGMKRVPSILCNPAELREVFVNIINNALDAMPDNGRITFRTWNGEDTVFISISDTGKGMSEEVMKNIFDPFFTTRTPVGTGLGLSTAYGIVTGHGGKIEVESKVGRGSTFTLQFPAAAKTNSPKESPGPEQEIKTNSLRILVVDDEEEICDILDKFLSKRGHLVRTVDSGREAIMLTKIDDYDLVLCDMAMPDVFGYDVIRALNKLEKRPKIGIITGWGDKLKPPEEEGLKVDFIIKKPFDLSELTKHINDVMNAG